MSHNLFTLLRAGFPAADTLFIERPGAATLSYGDVIAQSGRIANRLVALGVQPGDRVAAQVGKSAEALMLYLAVVRAGAVYLPLNPAYTAAEVRYFLEDAEPALFILPGTGRGVAARHAGGMPEAAEPAAEQPWAQSAVEGPPLPRTAEERTLLADAAAESPDFADIPRAADDLAAILYTSGTTGRSKGAMLTHDNLFSNAQVLRREWRFTGADRLLHALPIFHTHGLFVATNTMLAAGGSMILLPGFDGDAVMAALPRATVLMGVPTFYTRLLARPDFTRAAAAHMRLFVSGSAPLSAETHREFSERTGHLILERYGMTETNMNTSNPYEGPRVPGSVGPALPGVALRIADPESGRVLPQGEVGVIEVRGPNVFKGYWRMPEKTAAEFRADGYFITGDLGYVDTADYVWIVGRAKDLIISGGFNVYPAEVEAVLDALPGVAESAVIGVPHPDFGEGVVAVVAPRPGATLTEEGIRAALLDQLAKYKQPKRILIVEALPRNAMGKIQKKQLREAHAALFAMVASQWERGGA